jgi:hypothetical protein
MIVVDVSVAARRVGLPDLDQSVGHGATVAIEDAAADKDALADGLAGVLAREIVIVLADRFVTKNRSGNL